MCDRDNLNEMMDNGRFDWSGNRRTFMAAAGATMVGAAVASSAASACAINPLSDGDVKITTPDGVMDAYFVTPSSGKHPAVLMWPDIAGLRDAFKDMAGRLAMQGYSVLVANPYYRDVPAPQFADFAAFAAQKGFEKVSPWRSKLTADAIMSDARVLIGWLDAQKERVDTAKPVATNGYCMGGPFTVFTAAAVPDRVAAAASLHGAGLVKAGDPQSPDKLIAGTKASFLFAIGQNDDAKSPGDKTALAEAAKAAGRPAEVKVYPANHGWTVIDSPVYDKVQAEKAWDQMSALFQMQLA